MQNKRFAVTRREFVKSLGVATAAAAGAAVVPHTSLAAEPKAQYGMVIDTRKCKGCHACTVACKSEFDVPLGLTRSWVEFIEKGDFPKVARTFMPRMCNNCSDAACIKICPVPAAYKREEDGIVVFDQEECIGCKKCVEGDDKLPGCPYDVPFMNPATGTAQKCDSCLHRVSQGVTPSCVNTCPSRARYFGDLNDPESEVARLVAKEDAKVLYPDKDTKPNLYYIGADDLDAPPAAAEGKYVRVDRNRPGNTV